MVQDWMLLGRERVRQQVVHLLEATARDRLAAGAADAALVWAGLAVDAGPLRGSAQRLVLRAHLAAGNPGEARRHGERVRRMLADELGVAPSPQFQLLVASCADAAQPDAARGNSRVASNA